MDYEKKNKSVRCAAGVATPITQELKMPGSQSRKHTDKNLQLDYNANVSLPFPTSKRAGWTINEDPKMWGGARKKNGGERRRGWRGKQWSFFIFCPISPFIVFLTRSKFPSPRVLIRNDRLQRRQPIVKVNVMSDGRRRGHMWNVNLANKLNQTQSNHLCCTTGPILYFP